MGLYFTSGTRVSNLHDTEIIAGFTREFIIYLSFDWFALSANL